MRARYRWPKALWLKAWRESRTRFLVALGVVSFACVAFLVSAKTRFPPQGFEQLPFSVYVWGEVIGNKRPVAFALMALVLGLGGLQRERAARTAAFTLVLPATRLQMMATRAMTGLGQIAVLALIPAAVIPLLAPAVAHQSYPAGQAFQFAALYIGWGVVFFALGFLWSTVMPGPYTAIAASVVTPFVAMVVHAQAFGSDPLAFPVGDFQRFMSGLAYVDRAHGQTMLLTALPWMSLVALSAAALVVLGIAAAIVEYLDF